MYVKILFALLFLALPLKAAELLMVEREGCSYCAHFNKIIAPIYPNTSFGKVTLLKRYDIYRDIVPEIKFISPPRFTPSFILIENKKELGRIEGFTSDEFFWVQLERLFKKHNVAVE